MNASAKPTLGRVQRRVRALKNPQKARFLSRFFKTGPGEYAEGDIFLGLTVPQVRKIAREFATADLELISKLLRSKYHEERLLALLLWVNQYKAADKSEQKKICQSYLASTRFINNWDLVDTSADKIVGPFFFERPRAPLHRLARSRDLWERRIAVLSTFHFIRQNDFNDTLKICESLLKDEHDLIHKATGWMLREVAKRNLEIAEKFLRKHYRSMPRTMLRYAIERFPEKKRKAYLQGTV